MGDGHSWSARIDGEWKFFTTNHGGLCELSEAELLGCIGEAQKSVGEDKRQQKVEVRIVRLEVRLAHRLSEVATPFCHTAGSLGEPTSMEGNVSMQAKEKPARGGPFSHSGEPDFQSQTQVYELICNDVVN